jgi:hypothetical protein
MMKVKFLVSVSSSVWGSPAPGQVVEVPDTEAERYIETGQAQAVETIRENAARKFTGRKAVRK